MDIKVIFGTKVLALRKKRSMTQKEIGEIAGVSKQTIKNWEKGINLPPLDKICKLADYFGVSIDYLAGQTENPERNY